jgi:hypothetical protein
MSAARDPHCGTGDPWAAFVSDAKTPETVAMLRAWAEDPAEQSTGALVALEALSPEKNASLLDFWQQQLPLAPQGSKRRRLVVAGLINAGGTTAAVGLLGESDELDSTIVYALMDGADWKATLEPLRAHAAKPTTSAATRRLITERWLSRTRGADATPERTALMTSPDTRLALDAVNATNASAQTLKHSLALLGRNDLSPFDREQLTWDMGEGLGRLLAESDAAAQQLAATWARSTDEALLTAPYVQLVLGLWLQSRGELEKAEALFVRSLEAGRRAGADDKHVSRGSPLVPLGVTRLVLACQLEGLGRRDVARRRLAELAPSIEEIRYEADQVLDRAPLRRTAASTASRRC